MQLCIKCSQWKNIPGIDQSKGVVQNPKNSAPEIHEEPIISLFKIQSFLFDAETRTLLCTCPRQMYLCI